MEYLSIVGPITALLSFLGVIFDVSVIRPLNQRIQELNGIIQDLRADLKEENDRQRIFAEKIARMESDIRSLFKRQEMIERRLNDRRNQRLDS